MAHKKQSLGWGTPRKYTPEATLRHAYSAAKTARKHAGVAYKRSKTAGNLAAYRAAEMRWQATGQALGAQSGTHKPRKAHSHIFRGRKSNLSHAERAMNRKSFRNSKGKFVSRRKKHTKTARRR